MGWGGEGTYFLWPLHFPLWERPRKFPARFSFGMEEEAAGRNAADLDDDGFLEKDFLKEDLPPKEERPADLSALAASNASLMREPWA